MDTDLKKLWEKTLQILKNELSSVSFNTWVKELEPFSISSDKIKFSVPNSFTQEILEQRYKTLLSNSIESICSKKYKIEFHILSDVKADESEETQNKKISIQDDAVFNTLNPKYTFDTFVIGNSNRFAHAASLAVAEAPAKAYNPLFIYGRVGLGKTHLMHAIGHYILQSNPNAKVEYVSSEKFTNELINAIKHDKNEEFRNKYRKVDVLLIDDIQFIGGKEGTQEEFFHTFNALHDANKQIILSSDRPPKEIPTLEDRLRSRFEWGLIADIQVPDFETRMAILKKKADVEHLNVANEVMVYIATKIKSNIRELEGALIRIVAYSSLTNKEITVDLATEALKDIISQKQGKHITINIIQDIVANYFNLRIEDLKSQRRTRNISHPRQIAMYLSRKLTEMSLPKIGEEFGGDRKSTRLNSSH